MFKGSLVALVTPMHEDGSIDYQALAGLVAFHIEAGSDGLVIAGTTGEAPTLNSTEKLQLISRAVEIADGRIPIIAGSGSYSTAETLEMTAAAAKCGVAACLLVVPYYNKPTQEGLYRHFSSIADGVQIPQILYNVPARTVADLLPETVIRLAAHQNIMGIKEATGDLTRVKAIQSACGAEFMLYSGDDPTAKEFILRGGHGVITVTGNVAPRQMHEMCAAALAGEENRAQELDMQLFGLHKALFLEPNPIPVKWALHAMGRVPAGIRLPLTWLADQYQTSLRDTLTEIGILT
ncbi:MAG: 4-hydroxy-tetrahydrodipicolinate synthase [Gammaproteobacteria bacterium]|nr:4-hydroxy-tetrahydrodipicolinate synthase [Gammaproteobacteria bacterium]